jgi:endonuclease/exonuclease/phosphatase family metal-dependent hydrolase
VGAKRLAALVALCFGLISAQAREIVFASYNLKNYFLQRHESGAPKPEVEIAALVQIIAEIHPDILGICEMGSRSDFDDFRARLVTAGLDYRAAEYVEAADPERHLALLSRLPISSRQPVTDAPFDANGHREKVKRGFLDVTIATGSGKELRLVGAHLKSKRDTPDGEALIRRHEAHLFREHLNAIFSQNPNVQLLAYGDCNDTCDQPPIREITGQRGSPQYMADLPLQDPVGDRWTHFWDAADIYSRIDYIFASRALLPHIIRAKCSVYRSDHWEAASDHRPVIATLRVPD